MAQNSRLLGLALVCILLIQPVILAGYRLIKPRAPEELRPVMHYLNEHHEQEDVIYVYYASLNAFQYYSSRFDYTDDYIENPDFQLIVVSWNLDKSANKGFGHLKELYSEIENYEHAYSMIAITSALPVEIAEFKHMAGLEFDFFMADDVVLKTMIRANPGLILMKDGIVIGKWNYRDFPNLEEMQNTFEDF